MKHANKSPDRPVQINDRDLIGDIRGKTAVGDESSLTAGEGSIYLMEGNLLPYKDTGRQVND